MTGPKPPIQFFATLRADRMYLYAAEQALGRALALLPEIQRVEREIQTLEAKEAEIIAKHGGDPIKAAHATEWIAVRMAESMQPQMEAAYGALMADLALVHILAAAAAESHINGRAMGVLGRAEFEAFDKLALTGKWLFLPRLLGRAGFDPGEEPFQGLAKVARYRNDLMHHKPRRERWILGEVAPDTRERLGLSVAAAEGSLRAVRQAIRFIAEMLGEQPDADPTGLQTEFFSWHFEMTSGTLSGHQDERSREH